MPKFTIENYTIDATVDNDGDLTVFIRDVEGRPVGCTDEDLCDTPGEWGSRFTVAEIED